MPNLNEDNFSPELYEAIEAALWALKAGRPDVAEKYLIQATDQDGNHVTISLSADETIVEVS